MKAPRTSTVRRLLEKQVARCTDVDGAVDIAALSALVCTTYEEFEQDRRRADHANDLIAEELSLANTALAQTAQALRVQNERFEAALNNMSQGLCLFNAQRRLIVCNERLTRMLGLPAPATMTDLPLSEFIARSLLFRDLGDDAARRVEAYSELAARREHGVLNLELPDGRNVAIAHEPLPDGGFVHTFEDVTARRAAEARVVHLATHDVLTNLPNRRLLHQRLESLLSPVSGATPCAVLCLDLDRFKAVNDTLGHGAGDLLLQMVTQRLRESVRSVDTVARLGGDEFTVVLSGIADARLASSLAERLVSEMNRPFEVNGNTVIIGVSIGIALAPRDGSDPERLIKSADMALNYAKRQGRGCYHFFDSEMDEVAQTRRTLEIDLRAAIKQNEFELHYQPLMALDKGKVCAFEALVRWNSPSRGQVPPGDFIPLAEELGLIVELGEWVLHQACRAAAKWPDDIKVAVNVSAKQFKNQSLVMTVTDALTHSGLAAHRLELEITETVLLENEGGALQLLHELRKLGVGIVMDDFGTGYSSLAYLHTFPFDGVKIDRSFINGLGQKADAMAIVRAVTGLCNSLGMSSTAEGVETEEQLALLGIERCTQVQGYLFSKPRPERDIPELLRTLSSTANA